MAMAQVQSANTVGFLSQELDLDNDEYLFSVAAPFTNLGTVDGNYVCTDTIFDTIPSTGDKVYVFDSEEWNLAMYQYNGTGNGWTHYAADGTQSTVASFTVISGAHVMYEPNDEETIATVSGEVAASGAQVVEFEVTDDDWFFELVNPFPVATTLGDLETFCGTGDKIYIFDQDEWNLAMYQYNGTGSGWTFYAANGVQSILTDSTIVVLKAGEGAYFEPQDSREWTVTVNY